MTEKCILCRAKADWRVNVIHSSEPDCEMMCDRCYKAFSYGYRQAMFQNIDRFPELKEGL